MAKKTQQAAAAPAGLENVEVTKEMLAAAPELAAAGLQAGDVVGIEPAPKFTVSADSEFGLRVMIEAVRMAPKYLAGEELAAVEASMREFEVYEEFQRTCAADNKA